MLDVFFVTLTLAFFALYLYRQYALSGIFIGLAALAKLFAAMAARAAALRARGLDPNGPLTYVQGYPPWGEGFAGAMMARPTNFLKLFR